jgi:D-glycero-D-manno-heptose 1,7-bisphosphate phosphatase
MKRRALFLDRDGVINEDSGYVGTVDRFVFKNGVFAFLHAAQDLGYYLVIVTNQSGVGRGYYTEKDYENVTAHMLATLAKGGVAVAATDACYEHKKEALPPYNRESFWRKPNPGMILSTAIRLNIDLPKSVMLGDKGSDTQAAQAAGVGLCLLLSTQPPENKTVQQVRTFDEALAALTKAKT